MFAITKLSQASQEFVSMLTQNAKSRSLQASLAVAKVISCSLSLPSAAVEDIGQFYRTQCQIQVEMVVNTVNEIMVLDVKTVTDLVVKFYKYRYYSAHPACHVFAFSKDSAVEDFFGISREFDQATLTAVRENAGELTGYVNCFKKMIEELKA